MILPCFSLFSTGRETQKSHFVRQACCTHPPCRDDLHSLLSFHRYFHPHFAPSTFRSFRSVMKTLSLVTLKLEGSSLSLRRAPLCTSDIALSSCPHKQLITLVLHSGALSLSGRCKNLQHVFHQVRSLLSSGQLFLTS